MTAAELRSIRLMMGCSFRQFARVIGLGGGGASTAHGWESGTHQISGPAAMLIRIIAQRAILRRELGVTEMDQRQGQPGNPNLVRK